MKIFQIIKSIPISIINFIKKVWKNYLFWLRSLEPNIVGAIMVSISIIITTLVTIGGIVYSSYQKGERQIYYLQSVILQQENQLKAYSKLALQIEHFNRKFSSRYGIINPDDGIITIKRRINDIEESVLYKSELDKIMDDFHKTISQVEQINKKLERLNTQIHSPQIVASGDTHEKISRKFLTDEIGLMPKEAEQIINKTALCWDIELGNFIYNVYYDGIYLTTVTQGKAPISPSKAQARVRLAYKKKIENLNSQIIAYENEISILKNEIENNKASVDSQRTELPIDSSFQDILSDSLVIN